jgi:uncharacterized Zn finger protein (UPF0148 family)
MSEQRDSKAINHYYHKDGIPITGSKMPSLCPGCGNPKFQADIYCTLCIWKMEWGDESPDLPEEDDE